MPSYYERNREAVRARAAAAYENIKLAHYGCNRTKGQVDDRRLAKIVRGGGPNA